MPAKVVAVERVERVDGNPNLDMFTGIWLNLRGKAIAQAEKLWKEGKLRCGICEETLPTFVRPYCISQAYLKEKTLHSMFCCQDCGAIFSKWIAEAKTNADKKRKESPALS